MSEVRFADQWQYLSKIIANTWLNIDESEVLRFITDGYSVRALYLDKPIDWRAHSSKFAKGESPPATLETARAAWARDQELIADHLIEIAKLKGTVNQLRQKTRYKTGGFTGSSN